MDDVRSAPIGIIDSGVGGLTVMNALRTILPYEDIVYFGDTGRVPYGGKSGETILRYSLENASFLMQQKVKLLVIACHTISCYALEELQKTFPIPIVGMVEPSVAQAVQSTKNGKISIAGTRATIASQIYQSQIRRHLPAAEILSFSCPLFVPLVEEGYIDHPMTELAIREYLRPLKTENVQSLILACTHYPLLRAQLQKELGPSVELIDPGVHCAQAVKKILEENNLLNLSSCPPAYRFFVSDDPEKFRLLGKTFLNYPIDHVKKSS